MIDGIEDMRGAGEFEMDQYASTEEPMFTMTEARSLFYPLDNIWGANGRP